MRIIEIVALENGAHRNQTGSFSAQTIPNGWAVIPEGTNTPNFPFGTFEVEERYGNGVMYMVEDSWTPLPMPEPEPVPEPEVEPDVWDELAEAYRQGVQSAYDE